MSEGYDGMVILKTPLTITDNKGVVSNIYGWLYKRTERQNKDFIKKVVVYNAYLIAVQRFTERGGSISEDGYLWTDTNGSWFSVTDFLFQIKTYSENKEAAQQYLLVENDTPFVANENEIDDNLILSEDFITRYYPQYKYGKEVAV
ncbi:MAG: hypothetical protein J1F38_08765 [Muribaculaceae bacterium]|nr:hypothetical protein [Muribaculaceae bacterium]